MSTFETTGKEYSKIKETYMQYLKAYKDLNRDSLKGATPFAKFYLYKTFTSRYTDPKKFMSHVYR